MIDRQRVLHQTATNAQRRGAQRSTTMSFDYNLILMEFRNAMEARGIAVPNQIIADGKMHRCDAVGRKGQRGAAYKLHMDGFPAGGFENHHDGIGWENWKAEIEDTRTPAEKARFAQEIEEKKRRREAEARENQANAQSRANWIWDHTEFATPEYVYAARKQILPIGLGLYKGALVVPMHDINGVLHSLQFIKEDGSKSFLKDGRVEGCFFGLGEPGEILYVVEGYATGGSVHQATGSGVAIAFNSGNLLSVVLALRSKYPTRPIVICSDDDVLNVLRDVAQEQEVFADKDEPRKQGRAPAALTNAGLLAAYEAARAANARVAIPVFPEAKDDWQVGTKVRASIFRALAARVTIDPSVRLYRPGIIPMIDSYVAQHANLAQVKNLVWGTIATHMRKAGILADETDFNDLQVRSGLQVIRACIERASPPPALEVQELAFDIAI